MNRIERYLGGVVVSYTFLVMLVLLVILAFFEFMNQVSKLTDTYTLGLGAWYTLLKLPVYSYEIFPVVLLIGTLMGLGSLANQSELTILRVTGWSIKRILWAVLKTALLIWVFMVVVGEWLAPHSEAYAKKIRAEALNERFSVDAGMGSASGFWLRDGQRFIHVKQVLSSTELKDISVYEQTMDTRMTPVLSRVVQIKRATFDAKQQAWVFSQAVEQTLGFSALPGFLSTDSVNVPLGENVQSPTAKLQLQSQALKTIAETFPLKPEELVNLNIETRYLSAWNLYQYINFLDTNQLESGLYQLELWRKITLPLVVAAMIAIVFPLIFGSLRQVTMGQRVFIGVLIGMGFHLLNQLIGNLTVIYHFPIVLGALLPALSVLLVALFWLSRAR
ncbi:LPS export ABC transporter permease LptG [Thiomicrorhabdus aquaedulcis]|uniref:LPS export ABC transporter permease LptG n=1 Tax=Thiomicrorhabdus aquaedulcis TaxID=2211106 RepID=UPI000FD7ADB7|nr:LPS export ABC transporter permease LptG [Thiomicrorhabdus aquaedulcis]